MHKLLAALSLVALAAPAVADDWTWTRGDTIREATYLTLQLVDWRQSCEIVKHPELYRETNTILGEHPSQSELNRYHIAAALLHVGIARALPKPTRDFWQYVSLVIEVDAVAHNRSIGIRIPF